MATSSSSSFSYDIPPVPISDLTEADVQGNGAFDQLMMAAKGHLEQEFTSGRIKGPEYSKVYLGGMNQVLQSAVDFLIQGRNAALQAALLEKQIELADVELETARVGVEKALVELEILRAQQDKIPYEIAKLQAETTLLGSQNIKVQADTALVEQQTLNATVEYKVLEAQECKLRAEYDLILAQIDKAAQEGNLLAQKVLTERAQVSGTGVDLDSIIGRQKALYAAQADGFNRDAEQKATKIMVDAFSVTKTSDPDAISPVDYNLGPSAVTRAVNTLLQGIGA